jgi:lipopolysaccharide/colanic/teichoic acid biosynthesis glycosyltransferase
MQLCLRYVRERSFGTDLKILFFTALTVAGLRRPASNPVTL